MSSALCGSQPETGLVLTVVLLALTPFALTGIALINAGLTRTRAVTHVLFSSLFATVIAALAYLSIGIVWQSSPCQSSRYLTVAGHSWNVLGNGAFFLHGVPATSAGILALALFGLVSVSLCALIPIGAASERWPLGPALLAAAVQAAFIFPLYAHWSWPGGWLNQIGLADVGGSGFIHATGGLWALSVIWFAGPRRGKYSSSGMPTATPGHNAPYILAGCFLAWIGWSGLNGAGALLLGGAPITQIPYVLLNTFFSAAGGLISSAFITRIRFSKTDASLCANGFIGGLVAGSAGCTVLRIPEAMLVGLVAGNLVVFSVELLELRLKVDDPGGAVSVHGLCGLWGLLAVGLFNGLTQIASQLAGIGMVLGLIFPLTYAVNALLNRFFPYRAPREGERQGMDLYELGAGAYPEFMLHRDDFNLR